MALAKPRQLSKPTGDITAANYIDNNDDLKVLTLEQLADRFESISNQAQLLLGSVLLEARERFDSDIEFGEWITNIGGTLCSTTRQHRTRLMNLARFFKGKELLGISLTAAYEISAPVNSDVADKIYDHALNKNLPVAEIKKQIKLIKQELCVVAEIPKNKEVGCKLELLSAEDFDLYEKTIFNDVKNISEQNAIRILNSCIKKLRIKIASTKEIEEKNNEQSIPASEDTGNNS